MNNNTLLTKILYPSISFLLSSLGYIGDIIWEAGLNGLYKSIGIDNITGNTTWFCFVWFSYLRFSYLPKNAPFLVSDSFWFPELNQEYEFVKIKGQDSVFLFQNYVYYETDIATIEFLGELNFRDLNLRKVRLNKFQRAWSMTSFKLKDCQYYQVDSDIPLLFLKNGVHFIEINDVFSYYKILETRGESDSSNFLLLNEKEFVKWSKGISFQKSSTVRNIPEIESYIEFDYLKDVFNTKAVAGWLKGRYFPDIHIKGTVDQTLNLKTNDNISRAFELEKLYKIHMVNKELIGMMILMNSTDIFKDIATQLIEITKELKEYSTKDITALKLNRPYSALTFEYLKRIRPLKIDIQLELDQDNYSSIKKDLLRSMLKLIEQIEYLKLTPLSYNKSGVIISGEAFTGKTHIISSLIDNRFNKVEKSILNRCGESYDPNWFNVLIRTLECSPENKETLFKSINKACDKVDMKLDLLDPNRKFIRSKTKFVIATDALDEAINTEQWEELIKNSVDLFQENESLCFIYTTRPTFLNDFPSLIQNPSIEIINLDKSEIDLIQIYNLYKEKYLIKNIEGQQWLQQFFTNPLQIRLFFEAFEGQEIDFDKLDLSLHSLYDHYLNAIQNKLKSKDYSKKLSWIQKGFLIQFFTVLGNIMVKESRKWILDTEIISALSDDRITISEETLNYFLIQLMEYDLLLNDKNHLGNILRFQENSLVELSLAKNFFSLFADNLPDTIPEYMADKSGVLEMFAQKMLKHNGYLIFKDFWHDQASSYMREAVLLGVLKGVPNERINSDLKTWIFSTYA